jgi:formate hydrogenlyase subunit 6/NADH:ubiquinone oxidoreductase subunit I
VGDPIEEFILKDYMVNRSPASVKLNHGAFEKFMQKYTSPRPVIDREKCVICGTCIQMCPVQPKALSLPTRRRITPPVYDYDQCIRCYCCQETCPYEAITVKVPFLGRLLR